MSALRPHTNPRERKASLSSSAGSPTHLANKGVFVAGTPYSYLGSMDADDASGRRVSLGLNSAGFAIMNTVAYNLPKVAGDAQDLEGTIMADALRLCRTVDDFEGYVQVNTGRAFGAQTHFGVIDAAGGSSGVPPRYFSTATRATRTFGPRTSRTR